MKYVSTFPIQHTPQCQILWSPDDSVIIPRYPIDTRLRMKMPTHDPEHPRTRTASSPEQDENDARVFADIPWKRVYSLLDTLRIIWYNLTFSLVQDTYNGLQ